MYMYLALGLELAVDVLEAERMRLLDAELLQPQLGGVLLLQRRQTPLVPAAATLASTCTCTYTHTCKCCVYTIDSSNIHVYAKEIPLYDVIVSGFSGAFLLHVGLMAAGADSRCLDVAHRKLIKLRAVAEHAAHQACKHRPPSRVSL